MKISTKGRYAIRMMIDLAEHQTDGFVSLKDVADRQGISKKYLEQIIPVLSRAGFLQASRGSQGGYRLAKPASAYTAKDILELTEGSLAPVACLENGAAAAGCERSEYCASLQLWRGLEDAIESYLAGVTLQDLLDQQTALYGNNYII
jgi:Rrf2 family protein